MASVDTSPDMTDRAEAFREFAAGQLQAQTRSLDTIRTLLVLWTLLAAVGILVTVVATLAS